MNIVAAEQAHYMHPMIIDRKEQLAELCRRYDVVRLEVFGSAARVADFDPATSDVDFLVEFDRTADVRLVEHYFGLRAALRDLLDRPVDLVQPGAIRNRQLRAIINEEREVVYAS